MQRMRQAAFVPKNQSNLFMMIDGIRPLLLHTVDHVFPPYLVFASESDRHAMSRRLQKRSGQTVKFLTGNLPKAGTVEVQRFPVKPEKA